MVYCKLMLANDSAPSAQGRVGKALLQKSVIALVIKMTGLLAGFLFTYMVSRYYGASALGLFSLSSNISQIFILVAVLGFDNALLRFIASGAGLKKNIHPRFLYLQMLRISIPLAILLTLILWYLIPFVSSQLFHKPELASSLRWFSLTILPATLLLIHASGLRGMNKTGAFSFFRESSRFLLAIPLLLIFLVLFPRTPEAPSISYMIAVILAGIISLMIWLKNSGRSQSIEMPTDPFSHLSLIKNSLSFFFISALGQLFPLINSLLLGVYSTAEEVGIFNVSIKIASLLSLPLLAVNMASAPTFATYHETKNKALLQEAISHTNRIIFWSSLPFLLICLLLPDPLMEIFGSGFGSGRTLLMLMALAQFINAACGSVGVIMQMTGLERTWSRILLFTTLANVLLMVLLAPRYGMTGAAVCYLLVMAATNITGVIILKVKKDIRTYYNPFRGS